MAALQSSAQKKLTNAECWNRWLAGAGAPLRLSYQLSLHHQRHPHRPHQPGTDGSFSLLSADERSFDFVAKTAVEWSSLTSVLAYLIRRAHGVASSELPGSPHPMPAFTVVDRRGCFG